MYIVLPSLIIYSVAYFTNLNCQSFQDSEKGNENPYQPPKYIFQIVFAPFIGTDMVFKNCINKVLFRNLITYFSLI